MHNHSPSPPPPPLPLNREGGGGEEREGGMVGCAGKKDNGVIRDSSIAKYDHDTNQAEHLNYALGS